ncbi:MAG: stage III sporulation protein AF [Ruminococcus sp.]|jgi:stage III sporulation protein AF|nr:stage III sporulation protein AF [Ruminococcus sp.]
MVESIYTWMQNIVFYLVIVTAVLEVLPGGNYQKYIRFFTGLVLMILLLTPVLSLAGVKETFTELYHGYEYEQYKREIEEQEKYFEDLDLFEFLPEEYLYVQEDTFATDGEEAELRQDTPSYGKPVNEIKVEDISIGETME